MTNYVEVYMMEWMTSHIVDHIPNLLTIVITSVVTYIATKARLKDERVSAFKETTGRSIAESLQTMNDFAITSNTIEKYDLHQIAEEGKVIHFNDYGWYPSFMESKDSCIAYLEQIGALRRQHEKNLSNLTAAHLWYIEKYVLELMTFINSINMNNRYDLLGTIFIVDLQNWQQSFQRQVVKDINKYSTKVYLHRGRKWEKAKESLECKLYKNSILCRIQCTSYTDDEEIRALREFVGME